MLLRTIHSEKQIQVHVAPGVVVDGRIDLVHRLDTNELAIVDFKSSARDQDVTRDQLHVYAVGYEELSDDWADVVEILNLDLEEKANATALTSRCSRRSASASATLARHCSSQLPRHLTWCDACKRCDLASLCRSEPA